MNYRQDYDDPLRAQFTKWLDTTIYRVKLKYLCKTGGKFETVSLETLTGSEQPVYEESWNYAVSEAEFEFEEKRLADAFKKLPIKRRQILTLLFVEEMKSEEIARLLNCSVRYVYDQRYQVLKKLQRELEKGGGVR